MGKLALSTKDQILMLSDPLVLPGVVLAQPTANQMCQAECAELGHCCMLRLRDGRQRLRRSYENSTSTGLSTPGRTIQSRMR